MGEPRPEIGGRLGPRATGHADGQPPGGAGAPAEHTGDRGGALLAGEERLHDRRGLGDGAAQRVGPSGEQDGDDRPAGVEQRVEELLLGPGQREGLGVAALAAGAAAEQARPVAEDGDDDVGLTGRVHRLADAGEVAVVDAGAAGDGDVRVGELGGQRVVQRGQVDADRDLRVPHPDVPREGVAAEHGGRLGGVGADQGDAARPGQRQGAVVGQQDDRLLGDLAGQFPVLGPVQVDAAAQRLRVRQVHAVERGRDGAPVRVEQAEQRLLGEDAAHRPVDQCLRDPALGDRLDQRGAEGLDGGQFDVDARPQRGARGVGPVGGEAVQGLQEGDAEVVGDDGSLEPPGVAQQPGQQRLVGRGRHTVDVGVGVHDGAGAALAHGHLERRQQDVGPFAGAHGRGGEVAAGAGGGVADEVLEGGDDPGGLQAPHVRGADGADEVRVLADGLLHPSPAGVADHVEDGGEALVDADGPHVAADGGGHAAHHVRVEGGAPGQRHGVGRGAPGGEAGQALLVRDGGNAEAAGGGDAGLGAHEGERAEGGVDGDGAEGPGELAQSGGDEDVEVDGLLHVVLVGGDLAALVGGAHPHSVELGDLLLEGHRGDERVDSGGDGVVGVVPQGLFGGGLYGHVGSHFPPTPIRPWTRARRANR